MTFYIALNHMFHCLNKPLSIPLSFNLAVVVPRRSISRVSLSTKLILTLNTHKSRYRLLGSLILFDTYTFASQRQFNIASRLHLLIVFTISMNFTSPLKVQLTSIKLLVYLFEKFFSSCSSKFYFHIINSLHALYAQSSRVTLGPSVLPRLLARS